MTWLDILIPVLIGGTSAYVCYLLNVVIQGYKALKAKEAEDANNGDHASN